MTKIIKIFFISLFSFFVSQAFGAKKYTLVIDAGHGGKDPGTMTKTAKEKTINLNVALAFGRYVEQNCPDVKVIYTRKTDVFIPLHERAAIANRNKADVFISIHTNSVASKRPVSGLETYTMGMRRSDEKLSAAMRENDVVLIEDNFQQHYAGFDPRSPESYIIFEMINDANMLESVKLAQKIQRHACRTAKRENKGVKQDAFLVLRETSMPACLIELGYITTPSEEAYLTSKAGVDALARGIYQAFVEYKAERTGNAAPPTPPAPPATEPDEPQPSQQEPSQSSQPSQKSQQSQSPQLSQQPQQFQSSQPIFKVQFLTCDRKLKTTDSQMKGLKDVDCYKDGSLWKYTVGSTTDYSEIRQLRRQVAKSFPQAFIVAFRDGARMDLDTAINEANANAKKKKTK
jgi:N-acetylmuramoyl-L-alanine amidase